jgi:dihydroorotate dehydrogenase electron transfer subunit
MGFLGKVKILEKKVLQDDVFQWIVERPETIETLKPGQFFNFTASSTGYPLLKRPISISYFDEKQIEFTVKVLGTGTEVMSHLAVGDEVEIMGPLGNGFDQGSFHRVLIVGGGIGIAPLKGLLESGNLSVEQTDCILGFRDAPYLLDAFQKCVAHLEVVSENTEGYRTGFVTGPLEEHLNSGVYDMIYSCGPEAMLKQVAKICNERKVPVQLLMEEKMACGVGACLGCTCKTKSGDFGFKHVRMCKEGPMFYGSEVIFDA